MSDKEIFESSVETSVDDRQDFVKKEWVYCIDQQNGNYNSSQCSIDLSSLSNSGKFVGLKESFLDIPTLLWFRSTSTMGNIQAASLPMLMSLKNGGMQLVHSMSVEWNGQTLTQLSPYLNALSHFKALTSWSDLDVKKHGSGLYFVPDDTASMTLGNISTNAGTGNGLLNNINSAGSSSSIPDLSSGGYYHQPVNRGFYARCTKSGFDPASTTTKNFPLTTSAANLKTLCDTIGKDYYFENGGSDAASIKVWNLLVRIRMRDICDAFEQMPLVKNPYIKLVINFNTAVVASTMDISSSAINYHKQISAGTSITNGSVPFLVSSCSQAASNYSQGKKLGAVALTNGATNSYTLNFGCAIGTTTVNSTVLKNTFNGGAVRLYAPLYTFTKESESAYIQRPIKSLEYEDFYTYQVTNIASGTSFNNLVSNGISRLKYVLVMPFLSSTVTDQGGFAPYQSMFDTAPATTSPIPLTQFQVQVGGTNLFMTNQMYDWENFTAELSSLNALNGGLVKGCTSGLIDQNSFQCGHRFYIANCQRRVPAEDNVPRAVSIQGVNPTGYTIDLLVFCVYTKIMHVDVRDSKIQDKA